MTQLDLEKDWYGYQGHDCEKQSYCFLWSVLLLTTIAGGEGTTGGIIPPPTDFNNGQGTSPQLQHRPIAPIRAGSRSGILDHQQSPKILGSLTGDQLSSNLRKEVLFSPSNIKTYAFDFRLVRATNTNYHEFATFELFQIPCLPPNVTASTMMSPMSSPTSSSPPTVPQTGGGGGGGRTSSSCYHHPSSGTSPQPPSSRGGDELGQVWPISIKDQAFPFLFPLFYQQKLDWAQYRIQFWEK